MCLCHGCAYGWGFFAHQRINRLAVFCLPPEMMVLYKPHLEYLTAHATDPDKRRYAVAAEGARHYIDIDLLDQPPYRNIPRNWQDAVAKYTADSLNRNGILPWHLEKMMALLTRAFRDKDRQHILQLSAEIGHYIADAHVPLHACSNHNGQFTGQQGIHGLWESRIPELVADREFDYWAGKAVYLPTPRTYFWRIITESGLAADTVLTWEKRLHLHYPAGQQYAYENRNGKLVRTYGEGYTKAYYLSMGDMVERRMKGAIEAVAACWYTAWVNAGQPSLQNLTHTMLTASELQAFEQLQQQWIHGKIQGREE
ncbi:zinc dependent phospholipase C family protein [Chitinophaga nivalis]|uniref:Zinc dependent phospholipase C family protein n=2 Tax=Chitinophaga nivalis TaxID=2991709 RepID=A0ABT3IWI8_9BACT|nr:zinc dependent phospholipase C family protein [Chitinophaga nivalis]MCW3488318.1 zinc dependent phospholipase C family protein [Chitinophaga nivalis]